MMYIAGFDLLNILASMFMRDISLCFSLPIMSLVWIQLCVLTDGVHWSPSGTPFLAPWPAASLQAVTTLGQFWGSPY